MPMLVILMKYLLVFLVGLSVACCCSQTTDEIFSEHIKIFKDACEAGDLVSIQSQVDLELSKEEHYLMHSGSQLFKYLEVITHLTGISAFEPVIARIARANVRTERDHLCTLITNSLPVPEATVCLFQHFSDRLDLNSIIRICSMALQKPSVFVPIFTALHPALRFLACRRLFWRGICTTIYELDRYLPNKVISALFSFYQGEKVPQSCVRIGPDQISYVHCGIYHEKHGLSKVRKYPKVSPQLLQLLQFQFKDEILLVCATRSGEDQVGWALSNGADPFAVLPHSFESVVDILERRSDEQTKKLLKMVRGCQVRLMMKQAPFLLLLASMFDVGFVEAMLPADNLLTDGLVNVMFSVLAGILLDLEYTARRRALAFTANDQQY